MLDKLTKKIVSTLSVKRIFFWNGVVGVVAVVTLFLLSANSYEVGAGKILFEGKNLLFLLFANYILVWTKYKENGGLI